MNYDLSKYESVLFNSCSGFIILSTSIFNLFFNSLKIKIKSLGQPNGSRFVKFWLKMPLCLYGLLKFCEHAWFVRWIWIISLSSGLFSNSIFYICSSPLLRCKVLLFHFMRNITICNTMMMLSYSSCPHNVETDSLMGTMSIHLY